MTQVEDRHVVDPALEVGPDPVVVTSDPGASSLAPSPEAATPDTGAWGALELAAPRPLLSAVTVAGSVLAAVVTGTAVSEPAPLPVAAAVTTWTAWLALVVVLGRRRLRVTSAGLAYHDGVRPRDIAWADVQRVEVTTGPRVVRWPRLVLSGGRRVPLPPATTWSTDGVVSPLDRIAALAGEAGVPVTCTPSRRSLWIGAAVVVLGVLAGLALGVVIAAVMV